jgi:hypothetical protein
MMSEISAMPPQKSARLTGRSVVAPCLEIQLIALDTEPETVNQSAIATSHLYVFADIQFYPVARFGVLVPLAHCVMVVSQYFPQKMHICSGYP